MAEAARRISATGPKAVLVKGGHLDRDAVDLLYYRGEFQRLVARREPTKNTHGTGCTYSAAITAGLAKGQELAEAVRVAKRFITAAIVTNPGLGKGCGPVNHHAAGSSGILDAPKARLEVEPRPAPYVTKSLRYCGPRFVDVPCIEEDGSFHDAAHFG